MSSVFAFSSSPAKKHRIISANATSAVMPVARPSMPSVRFTAFENPVMMKIANATKKNCVSCMLFGFGIQPWMLSYVHDFRNGRVSVCDMSFICCTSWSVMFAYSLFVPKR